MPPLDFCLCGFPEFEPEGRTRISDPEFSLPHQEKEENVILVLMSTQLYNKETALLQTLERGSWLIWISTQDPSVPLEVLLAWWRTLGKSSHSGGPHKELRVTYAPQFPNPDDKWSQRTVSLYEFPRLCWGSHGSLHIHSWNW
ncbi:hypothetical protein H1C71_000237 [Ictidomys tridecemlineatus]|nr:hypothetical protein H1C71_000237 [Ictidomys tridecemlineatus]